MPVSSTGITSIAGYLPRLRLSRRAIAEATRWANPGLASLGKGHRTVCSPDEDSLTMMVEASRNALAGTSGFQPDVVQLASTTAPFVDRANSVLLSEALTLPPNLRCADFGGFLGAGVSALIDALESGRPTLTAAADKRVAKPGSILGMSLGHGAAAVVTGQENLIARFIAAHCVADDFVDHYRSVGADVDYTLEERWVRDEGHMKIAPAAITALLATANASAEDVRHLVIAGASATTRRLIAAACNIPEDRIADPLEAGCGNTGSAHALLMLAHVIEHAAPGECILVVNIAQGVQCLLCETTEAITEWQGLNPVSAQLAAGREDANYVQFLSFGDQIDIDWGIRAERDNRTSLSAFNRHRKTVTGFIGGKCTACGTKQFPKGQACVNPDCRSFDTLVDEPFQHKTGRIKSFTEDWLAISANPPLMYGNVSFDDGGVIMMEFTDFEPEQLETGNEVRFVFRIKDKDPKRNFHRYFWKAAPLVTAKAG